MLRLFFELSIARPPNARERAVLATRLDRLLKWSSPPPMRTPGCRHWQVAQAHRETSGSDTALFASSIPTPTPTPRVERRLAVTRPPAPG